MPLRRLARAVLPEPLLILITAVRARRHSHHLNRTWGVSDLSARLLRELGPSVQAGPFKGLVLPPAAASEHLGPYLLGTYERELHAYWASLEGQTVPLVVNVGSKVGYYAAGLARLLRARGIAYDADPWARSVLKQTIVLNAVDVDVRGRCSRADLEHLPAGALVMIDCDGCEEALLRDPLPSGLVASRLVIELHGASLEADKTAERLRRTHDVISVPSHDVPPPPPALAFLGDHERRLAVQEIREPQQWLLCTPLADPLSTRQAP